MHMYLLKSALLLKYPSRRPINWCIIHVRNLKLAFSDHLKIYVQLLLLDRINKIYFNTILKLCMIFTFYFHTSVETNYQTIYSLLVNYYIFLTWEKLKVLICKSIMEINSVYNLSSDFTIKLFWLSDFFVCDF